MALASITESNDCDSNHHASAGDDPLDHRSSFYLVGEEKGYSIQKYTEVSAAPSYDTIFEMIYHIIYANPKEIAWEISTNAVIFY